MMRLTLYSDYSLRVLVYLNRKDGEAASLTELADFYQISRNHLMKVVSNLRSSGFVLTEKGRGGGIWLARPANEITIGEVIRHTERGFDLPGCFDREKAQCVIAESCRLKSVLLEANSAFIRALDRRTLGEIAWIQP
ncbi:MAG TPA: Rrf2 family transcriptional regulator [Burkholderiales bacterium]|nr:Rrf2 family transcriptional regulator [Burkholderiales bacterium]